MPDTLIALYVFVLACFIGYYVIWGVTPSLHTPLVALTNAGTCSMGEGDMAAAEDYLRRALQLEAEFPDALIAMAALTYGQQKHLNHKLSHHDRHKTVGRNTVPFCNIAR